MKEERTKFSRCRGSQSGIYNDSLLFLYGLIILCISEMISDFINESQVFLREGRL